MNALLPVALLSIITIFFTSCSHEPKWKKEIDIVAKLYCQAKQLREARFELADSIRFIQDSLLNQKSIPAETVQRWDTNLRLMEERKAILTSTSRNLSDTIRVVLYNLTNNMSLDEKRIFNDSVIIHSERINCSNSPVE